jgi:hypothetical protein
MSLYIQYASVKSHQSLISCLVQQTDVDVNGVTRRPGQPSVSGLQIRPARQQFYMPPLAQAQPDLVALESGCNGYLQSGLFGSFLLAVADVM